MHGTADDGLIATERTSIPGRAAARAREPLATHAAAWAGLTLLPLAGFVLLVAARYFEVEPGPGGPAPAGERI